MTKDPSKEKSRGQIRSEIEDYFKSWFRKSFQKGVRDAHAFLGDDIVVICGEEAISFIELSIIDDEYSRQVVIFTRKKAVSKSYNVLQQNLEMTLGRRIRDYFVDLDIDTNTICMTFLLEKEEVGR